MKKKLADEGLFGAKRKREIPKDLTKIGVYLFMILIGVIICSLINMFIGSETFDLILTIICLLVFIVYIAYDIQIIKRNL